MAPASVAAAKRSPAKSKSKSQSAASSPMACISTSTSTSTSTTSMASPSRTNASDALPLPAFLKLLCSSPLHPLTMSEAIKVAKVLVPAKLNSRSRLLTLTQVEMARLGIDDEELRKKLSELTNAGKSQGKKARRKRGSDLDRPLPTREVKQDLVDTDLDFEEITYEETLLKKSCVTNRAPVMSAWAMVVAERLGFKRQEALSIAQVYTDMNATSKGVSLGIMNESALDTHTGSSQPFVDLMGRKVPVLSTANGEWRAITKGVVADPQKAFAYIQRAFRQQAGAIVGALRVLAESFEPAELNQKGYALYIEFRPDVKEWGEKSEFHCKTILDLQRHLTHVVRQDEEPQPKQEDTGEGLRLVQVEDADRKDSNLDRGDEEDVKPHQAAATTEQNEDDGEDEFDKLLDDDDEGIDFDALGV